MFSVYMTKGVQSSCVALRRTLFTVDPGLGIWESQSKPHVPVSDVQALYRVAVKA